MGKEEDVDQGEVAVVAKEERALEEEEEGAALEEMELEAKVAMMDVEAVQTAGAAQERQSRYTRCR